MKTKIVYLAGFMGAGKSTIGPILANTLGWDFFDLDHIIEKKTGKTVKDIFDEEGETFFRKLETETLLEISTGNNLIVALGGGTIASEINFDILKKTGKIIYLKTSPGKVYERLQHKRDRPVLLKSGGEGLSKDEFIEKINALFNERRKYYERADLSVDTDKVNIGKTVDLLVRMILKNN